MLCAVTAVGLLFIWGTAKVQAGSNVAGSGVAAGFKYWL
jgi:hypothetical protein